MIHLHEFVLNQAPSYYRDIVLCCLCKSLIDKSNSNDPDVEDVELEKCGHAHRIDTINKQGGNHSMLFLLKSFDLDKRNGYPLGTVFAYNEKSVLS